MKLYISSILILFTLLLISSCSEVKDNITPPPNVGAHGDGSLDVESGNFHGNYLLNSQREDHILVDCQQCHDADYTGGITTQRCNECHSGIQVHTGTEYKVPDHFSYFFNEEKSFSACYNCHGDNLLGGRVSPSCSSCHSPIEVHAKDTGVLNHVSFLPTISWDLEGCKKCHGDDYSGGGENRISPTCLTCHANPGGPEACNTCHGSFGDLTKIYPPEGLNNKEDRNQFVGAHVQHFEDVKLSSNVVCADCHIVPASVNDENHIDDAARSEVVFSEFASSDRSEPIYDQSSLTCQNTYCHGNFAFGDIQGNNFMPNFTKVDGSQAACGTCHGEIDAEGNLVTPKPTGHFGSYTLEECSMCHPSVVDSEGNIIDKVKHINKEKDF